MAREFVPLADRMKAYEAVRELVESEKITGAREIIAKLDARGYALPSSETIRCWAQGKTSPLSGKRLFTPRASDELSFFLGAWLGDGWADDNDGGKRLLLKVRSKDFAEEFARSASKLLNKARPYKVRVLNKNGIWYIVKVTSCQLYEFVERPFSELVTYIKPIPLSFLKGFFTAEGSTGVSLFKTSKGLKLGVMLCLSNTSGDYITFARHLLEDLGYHPTKITLGLPVGTTVRIKDTLATVRAREHQFKLTRLNEVVRFANEIGFADSEKNEKTLHAASLIRNYGPTNGAKMWLTAYSKIGKRWIRK